MKKPLNRVLLISLVVFMLPLLIFTVHQISTLNENEKVITEIYDNQLEAILFSVNQFSQDVVDAWARDINGAAQDSLKASERIRNFLEENEAVSYIFWSDSSLENTKLWSLDNQEHPLVVDLIKDSLENKSEEIGRLLTFQRGGYTKKEPLGQLRLDSLTNQSGLMFLLDGDSGYKFCLLVVDPNLFIRETLAQKIQSVTQEKFIISAYDDENRIQISILDSIAIPSPQKRPLWLLPDYSLGIVLKGETIQGLARKRTLNNLIILLGVDLILLLGLWLIYRNTKKEIQLAQIKSDFASNVSHEIRTPLALISMFAETLEMGRVSTEEKRREYYRVIGHEANRLAAIVNKILSFSKMEAGKISYNLELASLSEIVEDILKTYDYHLRSQGFICEFQPNGDLPLVKADQNAVSEAVINLLDNAIKYSNNSKEIEVTLGTKPGFVFVEVEDHGLGISTENQKHIFDKFYRVPTGSVHNTKGTGLGLTLVQHIMEAHGGSVQVESQPGQGSRFRLLFPLEQEKHQIKKNETNTDR